MNIEHARTNMITQQIRTCDVVDETLLDLFKHTPREQFVPETYRNLAFADTNIPLAHGQEMMTPHNEAQMLQKLAVTKEESVLEIGTGSGYITALLAQLGKQVYSVDIYPEFTQTTQEKLDALGLKNVTLETGDAANGWDKHEPYDVIAITASLPYLPDNFKQSLNIGGRLFAIIGDAPMMEATLVTRLDENIFTSQVLFETAIPPLVNAKQKETFTF